MRTSVTLPDAVAEAADKLAKRLRLSRSELYARALEEFGRRHGKRKNAWWEDLGDAEITQRFNALLAEIGPEATRLDPVLDALQLETLEDEDW